MNLINEELVAKWKPVLEHPDLAKIGDSHRRNVTAVVLENTEKAIKEQAMFNPQSLFETAPINSVGTGGYGGSGGTGVAGYDPILISLIRQMLTQSVTRTLVLFQVQLHRQLFLLTQAHITSQVVCQHPLLKI